MWQRQWRWQRRNNPSAACLAGLRPDDCAFGSVGMTSPKPKSEALAATDDIALEAQPKCDGDGKANEIGSPQGERRVMSLGIRLQPPP